MGERKKDAGENARDVFPVRLKIAMASAGYYQQAMADSTGISAPVIGKWLHGETIPRGDSLATICTALGCSADYLLGLSNRPDK